MSGAFQITSLSILQHSALLVSILCDTVQLVQLQLETAVPEQGTEHFGRRCNKLLSIYILLRFTLDRQDSKIQGEERAKGQKTKILEMSYCSHTGEDAIFCELIHYNVGLLSRPPSNGIFAPLIACWGIAAVGSLQQRPGLLQESLVPVLVQELEHLVLVLVQEGDGVAGQDVEGAIARAGHHCVLVLGVNDGPQLDDQICNGGTPTVISI